jgi:hypothetical protein
MVKLKLLSAALIAAATLATPAMARESHVIVRHQINATATPGTRSDGRVCVRAPDVGAFASQPYDRPPCEPMPTF